ncbi:MAG TPA: ribosome small subunit-dependent GTPase A [Candidatus Limnocylindrales bacterium]
MSGLDLALLGDALGPWGWNGRVAATYLDAAEGSEGVRLPGRVIAVERDSSTLRLPEGERTGRLAGRFRDSTTVRADLPATGDWVLVDPPDHDGPVRIVGRLPRASAFSRSSRDGGRGGPTAADEQVIAANVDVVLLVSGLDGDLNLRRLERYVALAWSSGASPVVVLNKSDLAADPDAAIPAVEGVARGVPVVTVSALTHRGLESLDAWLTPAATVALLGSSGVGKSSLANALLGEERQATGAVRADDSKGRHTTTRRELLPLANGALLLDTPGMRALELWDDGSGLDGAFDDIAALASACRFGDCRHENEPGCAVRAAVAAGRLARERLESHHKLEREVRSIALRSDPVARAVERKRWRAIHVSVREHMRTKYGEAYEG